MSSSASHDNVGDHALSDSSRGVPSVGPFELWMLAQFGAGLVGVGGLFFLIPTYVVSTGGTPADAGAVMAVVGALALVAPWLGAVADRYGAHRLVQLTALGSLGVASVSFAFAGEELTWIVAASFLGLGMAGLLVVNATFVVGAGFDDATQSRKLSFLQLSLPAGQIAGLAMVGAMTAADMSFRVRFLALGALAVVLLAVVAAVNTPAASRLRAAPVVTGPEPIEPTAPVSLRGLLLSPFGVTLLMITLLIVGSGAIESQYANYMDGAFGISPQASASALSVIVLFSIPLYLLAGHWTAKAGPRLPFLVSAGVRTVAGLGLLLLSSTSGTAALIVFALMMLATPFFELNAATLAAMTSPVGPGAGQGAMAGSMALGTILAAVIAGWLANRIGYSSLAAATLVASAAALVLGLTSLHVGRSGQSG